MKIIQSQLFLLIIVTILCFSFFEPSLRRENEISKISDSLNSPITKERVETIFSVRQGHVIASKGTVPICNADNLFIKKALEKQGYSLEGCKYDVKVVKSLFQYNSNPADTVEILQYCIKSSESDTCRGLENAKEISAKKYLSALVSADKAPVTSYYYTHHNRLILLTHYGMKQYYSGLEAEKLIAAYKDRIKN